MIKQFTCLLVFLLIQFNTHATELSTGQNSFQFHGYFRGGLGLSEGGNTQTLFQAPGARSQYRLGNEPDLSIELQLDYKYKLKSTEFQNSYIEGIIMLDGFNRHGESNDLSVAGLAQSYLSFNNFFNNDTKLWLGRRYYHRKSNHISNHFWLNPGQSSQIGMGLENTQAGSGKLSTALFRYEDSFNIVPDAPPDQLINSTNIDIRWHDLKIQQDTLLTLWATLTTRHENTQLTYDDKTGYGIGAWADYKSNSIKNTTVLLYRTGAAITQGDFNPNPIREDQGWDLDNSSAFEVNNTLTYESLPDYSFQWTILLREEERNDNTNAKLNWFSTGIRPIFYLSQHLNIAVEAGIDYIDDEINNRSGALTKLTTALQVSADRGLYSRPVMRFFITLADWDDDFKGLIGTKPGSAPYGDDTQGWTIGAQAEVWW